MTPLARRARLSADDGVLLLVDVQDAIVRGLDDASRRRLPEQVTLLQRAARRLEVPVLVTELDPRTYGHTLTTLHDPHAYARTAFSAAGGTVGEALATTARDQVVLVGTETHGAILQTALDLAVQGRTVHVVADAVGSRDAEAGALALEQLRDAGVVVTATSTVLLQWLGDARAPLFHQLERMRRRGSA